MTDLIYEDDYCIVRAHIPEDGRVAVQVGRPPEEARPTIVDGEALYAALADYLDDYHTHEIDDD